MLPAPNLDDRRFQDLVDDAKRAVQQRCPEWTDHNVSDPGVTLIELFAQMTDAVLYRLNQVPERNYLKFLDLVGVCLLPPAAATTDVTFWLSAPQREPVVVAEGTECATRRGAGADIVTFSTTADLAIVPCSLLGLRTAPVGGTSLAHSDGAACFSPVPQPGDALLVGLSDPVPSCAVAFRVECDVEGIGVDPDDPPLVWEAWTGETWTRCGVERDETGGLNRPGDIVLHVPPDHVASVLSGQRAGWLRARVVEAGVGKPDYSVSPTVRVASACTVGGTIGAVHGRTVRGEVLGSSQGVAGQRFRVAQGPVVPGVPAVVEVDGTPWTLVDDLAAAGPRDRHVVLEPGEVCFGPAVREPDGALRSYGAVPPRGAVVTLRAYRTGGGAAGNVRPRTLTVLRSSIPCVSRVENRREATGGRDGETVEQVKARGPLALRTRNRAVTAADFEYLTQVAAPELARVRCVPGDPVRVLVVPAAVPQDGRLRFGQLVPEQDTLRRVAEHLDTRRVLGSRVVVEPPRYVGVTVVAEVRGTTAARDAALEALYAHFSPLSWEFGRPVQTGDVHAVLAPVVDLVEQVRLFPADPVTGERGAPVARIAVDPGALVFSYDHQVLVLG